MGGASALSSIKLNKKAKIAMRVPCFPFRLPPVFFLFRSSGPLGCFLALPILLSSPLPRPPLHRHPPSAIRPKVNNPPPPHSRRASPLNSCYPHPYAWPSPAIPSIIYFTNRRIRLASSFFAVLLPRLLDIPSYPPPPPVPSALPSAFLVSRASNPPACPLSHPNGPPQTALSAPRAG